MAGRGGGLSAEEDPMAIYQVFQNSYNKITAKTETQAPGAPGGPAASYPAAGQGFQESDMRQHQWQYGGGGGGYQDHHGGYYGQENQDWAAAAAASYPGYGAQPGFPPHLEAGGVMYPGGPGDQAAGAGYSPAPAQQAHQLDDAINVLRNHVDFAQVPVRLNTIIN